MSNTEELEEGEVASEFPRIDVEEVYFFQLKYTKLF